MCHPGPFYKHSDGRELGSVVQGCDTRQGVSRNIPQKASADLPKRRTQAHGTQPHPLRLEPQLRAGGPQVLRCLHLHRRAPVPRPRASLLQEREPSHSHAGRRPRHGPLPSLRNGPRQEQLSYRDSIHRRAHCALAGAHAAHALRGPSPCARHHHTTPRPSSYALLSSFIPLRIAGIPCARLNRASLHSIPQSPNSSFLNMKNTHITNKLMSFFVPLIPSHCLCVCRACALLSMVN